ncbi:hypothetical protein FK518_28255, partial [Klebsiella pneumoniae]|nr:hypothetical protein [Klebsiella pneumoniae]
CEMPPEEDLAEDGTSSPAASTSQEPQASPLDASEDLTCPICLDRMNDEASMSVCMHVFCFSCILDWSSIRAVCPICQQPFRCIYRKVGVGDYEMYLLVDYNRLIRNAERERPRSRSVERRRPQSSGRRHRRSPSRDVPASSGRRERRQRGGRRVSSRG